jgi:hypothetical protein
MPANREPLHEASDRHSYFYRRTLKTRDYLPAIAIGLGAGLLAFYVAARFAQRTPLLPESDPAVGRPKRRQVKGTAG